MLAEIFPRFHSRFSSLPLLGPHLDGFVVWLRSRGYPEHPIRMRIRETPRVEALLRRGRARRLENVTVAEILRFVPPHSQDDVYLAAVVRSLARYLDEQGVLSTSAPTPSESIVAAYRSHLERVRGLAESTITHHSATAAELLDFLDFDSRHRALQHLGQPQLEEFVRVLGARIGRASLQHTVAHLRSFLRFLGSRGDVARGLDSSIDTPRLYRGERLPRSLPWQTVQDFLAAIDRSTPMGQRDYAIFLLIGTYGLRTSEIAALCLDDLEWRGGRIHVPRSKTDGRLALPLTDEVGAAVLAYLRHARPSSQRREVFLRVRAPAGPLAPTAVTEAFQRWARRSGLSIPFQGPHCLRHSLAIHLLRQGAPLKAIGDLLGHRSIESTAVYLRLHVTDLRDAALNLPHEVLP